MRVRMSVVFAKGPITRSVPGWERLAIMVATQMSLCPLRSSSSVLKPASKVMNKVAPRLWLNPLSRATRSFGMCSDRWVMRAASSPPTSLFVVANTGEAFLRHRFQ